MIRYIRYLFLAALVLALVSLAMANRGAVALRALPDDLALLFGTNYEVQVPLFLVMFAGVAIGLVLGFAWEWAREHKHRAAAATGTRQVKRLERELAVMKDSTSTPKDEILALLDGKKA